MRQPRLFYAALLSIAALTGCGDSQHSDLRQWLTEKRATARPSIVPLDEPSVFSPQPYLAAQGVEPFNVLKLTNVLSRESATQNASQMALLDAEKNRRKEDLEAYPLDTMAMVGSLRKSGGDTALLRVNQLIYQVRVGNYLGQNYGRIEQITENGIKLREIIQDPSGDWVEKTTTLELQEGKK